MQELNEEGKKSEINLDQRQLEDQVRVSRVRDSMSEVGELPW